MISVALKLVLAAIPLGGVVGERLRARAFFDANNVKVGDPLILTVDFLGEADFRSLHPPALSKAVERKDWKLDDASAKTDTYRDARRLTYRVRPMREGLLWFPALEFEYTRADGGKQTVKANAIPVHAKGGVQVTVDMDEVSDEMPDPGPLVRESGVELSDDENFAWLKACASPSPEAFERFAFPAARLNRARELVLDGKWSEALKIYSALEWSTGQTPEIERGIVAALARKTGDPGAELPVWRQLARPVLQYGWKMRAAIVVAALALLTVLFKALSALLRVLACMALMTLAAPSASATDIFERMNAEMEAFERRMRQSMGSPFSFAGGHERVKIEARLKTDRTDIVVADGFEFLISVEAPKDCALGDLRLNPVGAQAMSFTGGVQNLPDAESSNPSNVVKRLSVPVRCDAPFKGKVLFEISGTVSSRRANRRGGGFFNFTFSNSFKTKTNPIVLEIKPLPEAGKPEGFTGVVAEKLVISETLDLKQVGTNDVICITYTLDYKGFVPVDFVPPGAAFEIYRDNDVSKAAYRAFFVASGEKATPEVTIDFYNPRTRKYERAVCGGTPVEYVSPVTH